MGSFKGSDTTQIEFDVDELAIVDKLLAQTTFAGVHLPVASTLDFIFTDPEPGELELSHDQIALLLYVIDRSAFGRAARTRAADLRETLKNAHDGFYKRAQE